MRERSKRIISIAIIVVLLPYILTVFIKGEGAFPVQSSMVNTEVLVNVNGVETSVSWEMYLVGLLAKEIPEEYSLEAMKAQSVIIQTRLEIESSGDSSYVYQEECYSTEEIQTKWGNQSVEYYNLLVEAVQDTYGMMLEYNGTLASTPYHILNTGMTRSGNEVFDSEEYSYLTNVSCPLDIEAEDEITMFTIAYDDLKDQLEEALEIEFEEMFIYEDFEIVSLDEAGYVLSVGIQGNIISGEVFRTTLALKSSAFSFQEQDGVLKITTEGVGHGLGLSQNTAHYMGLEGKSYEEIIQYFYPGTEIVKNNF